MVYKVNESKSQKVYQNFYQFLLIFFCRKKRFMEALRLTVIIINISLKITISRNVKVYGANYVEKTF